MKPGLAGSKIYFLRVRCGFRRYPDTKEYSGQCPHRALTIGHVQESRRPHPVRFPGFSHFHILFLGVLRVSVVQICLFWVSKCLSTVSVMLPFTFQVRMFELLFQKNLCYHGQIGNI